jgi:hypothetical protein
MFCASLDTFFHFSDGCFLSVARLTPEQLQDALHTITERGWDYRLNEPMLQIVRRVK